MQLIQASLFESKEQMIYVVLLSIKELFIHKMFE
jgi:hypothetical protein